MSGRLVQLLLIGVLTIGMFGATEAQSKQRKGWIDRLENRRDARRAGVVAGAVASGIAGSAARGKVGEKYENCMQDIAVNYEDGARAHDPQIAYLAERAEYECEMQRYEARNGDRRAARRAGVVAGAVAYGIVRD